MNNIKIDLENQCISIDGDIYHLIRETSPDNIDNENSVYKNLLHLIDRMEKMKNKYSHNQEMVNNINITLKHLREREKEFKESINNTVERDYEVLVAETKTIWSHLPNTIRGIISEIKSVLRKRDKLIINIGDEDNIAGKIISFKEIGNTMYFKTSHGEYEIKHFHLNLNTTDKEGVPFFDTVKLNEQGVYIDWVRSFGTNIVDDICRYAGIRSDDTKYFLAQKEYFEFLETTLDLKNHPDNPRNKK